MGILKKLTTVYTYDFDEKTGKPVIVPESTPSSRAKDAVKSKLKLKR